MPDHCSLSPDTKCSTFWHFNAWNGVEELSFLSLFTADLLPVIPCQELNDCDWPRMD